MAKQILIIDDDSDDRELFGEALAAVDPTIGFHSTEGAEEALNKLYHRELIQPDLIFLDINLPGMSGWQCLTELKKHQELKQIPVIMYSTSGHQRDKEIATDLGAVCLLTKPSSYRDLKHALGVLFSYADAGNLLAFAPDALYNNHNTTN